MSIDTWGLIPKAQDDNQKIDEAIAAAIVAHEADSEAHLGAGESLESHRASEVIDHKAYSIVSDKINNSAFSEKLFIPYFISLDAFDYTAYQTDVSYKTLEFNTSSVLNNEAYLGIRPGNYGCANFSKDSILEVPFILKQTGTHLAYIGIGDNNIAYSDDFVGFQFSGGHIYARTRSSDTAHETTVDLGVYTTATKVILRIEFNAGVNAKFYIDGSLVATITDDIPTITESYPIFCYLKTTQSTKTVFAYLFPFTFEQEL